MLSKFRTIMVFYIAVNITFGIVLSLQLSHAQANKLETMTINLTSSIPLPPPFDSTYYFISEAKSNATGLENIAVSGMMDPNDYVNLFKDRIVINMTANTNSIENQDKITSSNPIRLVLGIDDVKEKGSGNSIFIASPKFDEPSIGNHIVQEGILDQTSKENATLTLIFAS